MRAAHPEGAFYEAFFDCATKGTVLGNRAKAFLEKLDTYRAESRLVTVEELIGILLDETGFMRRWVLASAAHSGRRT